MLLHCGIDLCSYAPPPSPPSSSTSWLVHLLGSASSPYLRLYFPVNSSLQDIGVFLLGCGEWSCGESHPRVMAEFRIAVGSFVVVDISAYKTRQGGLVL